MSGSATLMVLLPEHGAGFFVATHREGSQLRYALQRHPGEDRTTVYLEGPQELPEVGAPGERYAWRGLTGEVWFRSDHQLGLTVDQWGAGLLVLQEGSAVLTGYGVTPAWDTP